MGLDIAEATIKAAKRVLFDHHATDADTMLSWSAQLKMQNRLSQLENMMNGNYHATPNQKGMMPWGKVEIRAGKAAARVVGKMEKGVAKVVGAKAAKQLRTYRDLAADAVACTPKVSAPHSSNRKSARIASCWDTGRATVEM